MDTYKTMRRLFVFILISSASMAFAQSAQEKPGHRLVEGTLENTPKELLEYCKTTECRKDTHFTLKMVDGSHYEYKGYIDPPAVQSHLVTIYPGEALYIEADLQGKDLVNLKQVEANIHPEKTIFMVFSQIASIGDGTGMMLTVTNPFKEHLRYEIGMMAFDSEDLQYTSSCAVMPEKLAMEHWPFPIFQLAFTNIRLIDIDPDSSTCE